MRPIGNEWLKLHYKLSNYILTHTSYIGSNESIELTSKGNIIQVYGTKYDVEDAPLNHVEFGLKYDDFNLDFLKAILEKIPVSEVELYVAASPGSRYSKKIGFLFEFLTGKKIDLSKPIAGNYVDLLDPTKYITSEAIKNTRWRINNNLLGSSKYCPIVRKTKELKELLDHDIEQKIGDLKKSFNPEIFSRAINYLYKKETKSSYEIEREEPTPDRMERFVSLLAKAGTVVNEELLSKERLVHLQNAIVDPRFAALGFRHFQNYVGESLPYYNQLIHYVCPPPSVLFSAMEGLQETATRTNGISPEIRAAIISFGFVFIHPFEDGNGRIHRFLIHDVLVHDKIVPHGLIIPVSAHMLNNMKEYDAALEKYSKPLLQRVRYEKLDDGEIKITNEQEVEGYYRFPDLTDQCVYLIRTLHATLTEDMPDELLFIQRYDEAKKELQRIVDMPDKLITMMLTFLHQNKGVFPKRRRESFSMLSDEEITKMQTAYRKIFDNI